MPKTQYYTATSLDGYIADEHNSLDWLFETGDGLVINGLLGIPKETALSYAIVVHAALYIPITLYAGSILATEDRETYYTQYHWGWMDAMVRRKPGVSVDAANSATVTMLSASALSQVRAALGFGSQGGAAGTSPWCTRRTC